MVSSFRDRLSLLSSAKSCFQSELKGASGGALQPRLNALLTLAFFRKLVPTVGPTCFCLQAYCLFFASAGTLKVCRCLNQPSPQASMYSRSVMISCMSNSKTSSVHVFCVQLFGSRALCLIHSLI